MLEKICDFCYNFNMKNKIEIKYVTCDDREFWLSLDKHLTDAEFDKKVRDGQGYVLTVDGRRAGLLRYNLFWDNTPFCTRLFVAEKYQNRGYGSALLHYWEKEMKALGYGWLLVSTQSDESAQHFYRKLGYKDCGSLLAPNQPTELFLSKTM